VPKAAGFPDTGIPPKGQSPPGVTAAHRNRAPEGLSSGISRKGQSPPGVAVGHSFSFGNRERDGLSHGFNRGNRAPCLAPEMGVLLDFWLPSCSCRMRAAEHVRDWHASARPKTCEETFCTPNEGYKACLRL